MITEAYEYIHNYVASKKILIYGMGKEGKSTLEFFQKYFPNITVFVFDEKDNFNIQETNNIKLLKNLEEINKFDLIFKSPGIVIDDKLNIDKKNLTSQTELFFRCFKKQIIGITGTKGKSTTSSLLYYILKQYNKNTIFVGNIGIPCFDMIEEIDEDTTIVFELSCHQLEYVEVSPHIAVIINLYPEHLDHYKTVEKYFEAKTNILNYQIENDVAIINFDDLQRISCRTDLITASNKSENADIKIVDGTIYIPNNNITIEEGDTLLLGNHNLYNIGIVYFICNKYFNLSNTEFKKALKTFKGLPHRLEFVGNYDGIEYYDDSISTISETTIEAIKTLNNVSTLLLGGMDRGVEYSKLVDYIIESNIENVILMPNTDLRIDELFSNRKNHNKNIILANNLKDAVKISKEITPKGGICLLSPAAASYGFFKNFEERGDKFKEYVKTIQ